MSRHSSIMDHRVGTCRGSSRPAVGIRKLQCIHLQAAQRLAVITARRTQNPAPEQVRVIPSRAQIPMVEFRNALQMAQAEGRHDSCDLLGHRQQGRGEAAVLLRGPPGNDERVPRQLHCPPAQEQARRTGRVAPPRPEASFRARRHHGALGNRMSASRNGKRLARRRAAESRFTHGFRCIRTISGVLRRSLSRAASDTATMSRSLNSRTSSRQGAPIHEGAEIEGAVEQPERLLDCLDTFGRPGWGSHFPSRRANRNVPAFRDFRSKLRLDIHRGQ